MFLQGQEAAYTICLIVRDLSLRGRCLRSKNRETGHVYCLVSPAEKDYFDKLEWSEYIIDIREQYPLLLLNVNP
jgi:hypothetical protein